MHSFESHTRHAPPRIVEQFDKEEKFLNYCQRMLGLAVYPWTHEKGAKEGPILEVNGGCYNCRNPFSSSFLQWLTRLFALLLIPIPQPGETRQRRSNHTHDIILSQQNTLTPTVCTATHLSLSEGRKASFLHVHNIFFNQLVPQSLILKAPLVIHSTSHSDCSLSAVSL